jgi:O-antigen/teichoic acid export membrane protein/glycosyltransferase involved in cell wall biosynthesis
VNPKIVVVVWTGGVGGAETLMGNVAIAMHRRSVDVSVLCIGGSMPLAARLREEGVPCFSLGHRHGVAVGLRPRGLAGTLRALGPSGAIVNATGYLPWLINAAGYRPPMLAVEHGELLNLHTAPVRRRLRVRIERWLCKRAPYTDIVVSDAMLDVHRQATGRIHVRRIYNGVDLRRFHPNGRLQPTHPTGLQEGKAGDEIVIGVASRLVRGKGIETLINACTAIGSTYPWHLQIAGDGPESDGLRTLVDRTPALSERVTFMGTVSDMPRFWASCDIAVVASSQLRESFSMAAVEAMACGLPVIASADGALPEICGAATGILIPPGDAEALTGALESYLRDPDLRRVHGAAGRQRAAQLFDIEQMVDRYLQVLREVGGSTNGAASNTDNGVGGNAGGGPKSSAGDVADSSTSNAADSSADQRPAVRRMLVSASATAALQGASTAMGFVLSVLLARFLGSVGYGRYAVAFAWASLLTTPAILGLDRFLVRGIAVYEVHGEWSLMKGLLRRTNQLVLLTSLSICACSIVVGLMWVSPVFRGPFCVAMLLIPITALTLLRQGAMQAVGRVVSGQLPEYLVRPLLIILGVVALELAGGGALTPATALGANVAGVAVAFVLGAVLLRRALPTVLRSVSPKFVTRAWLRASLPMMLISGVWMANAYVSTLVVGTLAGAHAAGVYNVAQRGAELILVLLFATNMPLAPAAARLHARGDMRGLEHTTERMARATFLVSLPVAAAFIAFPGVYMGLFGAGFRTGATALVILALGQLFNAVSGPSGNILIMTGHERAAVRGVAAGLLANVLLAIALVPSLGATGGAIAFACSLVLWNIALVVFARRLVGVNVTAFHRLAVQGTGG